MQAVSQLYKDTMKEKWRGRQSYIRVTIGLINQEAQASAYVPDAENYTYYSNLKWPLDNYQVKELYAACDQDYTAADGSMYFLPRDKADVVLNQGIVSEGQLGPILVKFPLPFDIKGLTIEFGRAYPVDFTIESDNKTVKVTGNTSGRYITENIFSAATYLRFVPSQMSNGQGRFRIHQLTMGIGIYFDNRKILSASKKEHISPIMEELPTIDFDMTIANKDRGFDVENEESTVNFLEIGQDVEVIYGQEMEDGSVEWMPGARLALKEWSADDEEMSFSATDRFDGMDGTYYRGKYRQDEISLYDLAVDVFEDAGVDPREYWLDTYLRDVRVKNPIPVVTHKEALQIIANAGRCILYQDRTGSIFMKSSFVPDMEAGSDNQAYFSHADRVLDHTQKEYYAMAGQDGTSAGAVQYFLPQKASVGAEYLNTGYVSEAVADEDGSFTANPTLSIALEAAFKCFGLTLEFGGNSPKTMAFHSYKDGILREDYLVNGLTAVSVISHEFPEFDLLVLEFTKGAPNSRVVLDNITFGESTDYILEYGHELTKTPKGIQLQKVKELQVLRTRYNLSGEVKELAKETLSITGADNRYTFYFSNPSYDLSCTLTEPQAGQAVEIVESSDYYVMVAITGVSGTCEVAVTGREYVLTQAKVSRQLNPTGTLKTWENPLVSSAAHAQDLAGWIGDYMAADREYELSYRGEPRIDANDIAFLENKYVDDLLIRVYDHTLSFNGALSGSIRARRDMSGVATAKNRLAGK